jgi:hypothetical protein
MSKQGAQGAQGARGARGAIHARFRAHLRTNVTVAAMILAASLGAGMIGYHLIAELGWVDAFLNAAMILAGMGPVAELTTDGAKLFAGAFAIYCGVVFIATVGLVLAPVVSHALHRFHLDEGND